MTQTRDGTGDLRLKISYSGSTVTVTGWVDVGSWDPRSGISDPFALGVSMAHHILDHFSQNYSGSVWGCDGVGYFTQKRTGQILVHKSGIGRRSYQVGQSSVLRCQTCKPVVR